MVVYLVNYSLDICQGEKEKKKFQSQLVDVLANDAKNRLSLVWNSHHKLTQFSDVPCTSLNIHFGRWMNNRFIDGVVEYLIEISEDSYTISPGMLKVDAGIAAPRHNQGQAFVKPAKEKKSKMTKTSYILPTKIYTHVKLPTCINSICFWRLEIEIWHKAHFYL